MLLLKNQHVKIIFKNSITIEGIVLQWDPEAEEYKFVLKALDDNSLFIINGQEDILIIKIVDNSERENMQEAVQEELQKEEELEKNFEEIKEQVDEVYEKPRHDLGDIQSLVNLRKKLAESEKQLIANKLRQHHIKDPKGVKYEHGFFKK